MATIQQLQALKQNMNKLIDKLVESFPKSDDVEDSEQEVKLTPLQKLEKRLETANEKLAKLVTKIDGGKSKIPDKDEEAKTKLEETISELQTKIAESQKPAAKPAAKKAVKAEVEAKPKTEEAKPSKNILRITPAMTTQFKAGFGSAGSSWDGKYKKEFVDEMNAMDAVTYASKGLESRMTAFAESKNPAAGGSIQSLSVAELHSQNKNLTEVSAGIYQHKTTGKQVTGPPEVSEEDLDDANFEDVDYVVGSKSKRVYLTDSEEFVGYWGVGKFYNADL